ncbi:hypothetical protein C0580_00250 [Candidatus Parcubacteria bacterium]|nr:MAG: hypothetical protein C0580_00250 [Candidatus Parcubacteria bacterium]
MRAGQALGPFDGFFDRWLELIFLEHFHYLLAQFFPFLNLGQFGLVSIFHVTEEDFVDTDQNFPAFIILGERGGIVGPLILGEEQTFFEFTQNGDSTSKLEVDCHVVAIRVQVEGPTVIG